MTVVPDDIAETLGLTTPAVNGSTYKRWQRWIRSALLLIQYGDGVHAGLGDPGQLDPTVLDYVVTEAVAAMVRRPDDATQVDIQVDGDRVSRTYQSGAGRVTILDQWWTMLAPAVDEGGAFSIRPSFEPDLYCPLRPTWPAWSC